MEKIILSNDPKILIDEFIKKYSFYTDEEKSKIILAWDFLVELSEGKESFDGNPFFLHPYRVALIVADYHLDYEAVIASFFHNVFKLDNISEQLLKNNLSDSVYNIILNLDRISKIHVNTKTLDQADAVRKMFFAIANDMRVILVKLAERVDLMRNLKSFDEQTQKQISQQILDVWAPLADRLGIKQGKNELEDLSLKYLNNDAYLQIKSIVAAKKDERSEYLEKAKQSIYKVATKVGIEVSISSRAKHFYSIYQKMRKRNKEPGELYDLLAMRILCNTNSDCYTLLGIVHNLWKPLEGRFKDYIAMPKANGYQSLHTTVMAEGRPLEIQIRTKEMHNIAEHGVASHWLYKKGSTNDKVDIKSLPLVNQIQQLCEEHISDDALFNELKNNLLKDKIVVFTPNGDVKQLPVGATAIDFAYSIHSDIGLKISGAKADGKIIPLSEPLKNTQIIEIITNPNSHPTENQLQHVVTYKARQKINWWLSTNGEQSKVVSKVEEEVKGNRSHKKGLKKNEKPTLPHSGKIRIGNTTNFIITMSKCCNPKFPDDIIGYVSKARGITIHKKSCYIYNRIPAREFRSVEVEWDEN